MAAATLAGPMALATATASPASAAPCNGGDRPQQVQIFRGGDALIIGRGTATTVPGNKERWCDLWEEEGYIQTWPPNPFPQVCAYQSGMVVYNPDGSSANRQHFNSFHPGCSWAGWGYHDPLDGPYAENKRFASKWRSDATNGWELIGYLVD